ncbi:transcriptional regulator [Mycolicibacterium sp. 120266]|uniref:transcriptional regulator n=1 Tax=Mycolicibacterium sp. 120266 TaxID=3090601 RepID=UPI00299DA790|nr:transcriptional regulator [Mycolicibacterium sp. 120266]MDX1874768.1 transcriptional regulator [Mycolicibacterium sp. 120266]
MESDNFAARLNRLFETIYPPGRGPFTSTELVRELGYQGSTLSAPYLSQLRTGQRVQPSRHTLELIAGFFGIRSDYFTGEDDAYLRQLEDDLHWWQLARDPAVRQLTTALLELTPEDCELALSSVERTTSGRGAGVPRQCGVCASPMAQPT